MHDSEPGNILPMKNSSLFKEINTSKLNHG